MILSGFLLVYAAVVAITAGQILPHAQWLDRSPRLGIVLWLGTSAAVLMAVLLAGMQVLLPAGGEGQLGGWLRACLSALATDQGAFLSVMGLVVVAVVTVRMVGCVGVGLLRARSARLAHADSIALLAPRAIGVDAVVVDCSTPAVYCLPGRRRQIVLTSRALELLNADEVQAVLAHERAHLRGRHHLVRTLAESLHRAFPWVTLFRRADQEVCRLLEMLADDRAAKDSDRIDLASAMASLAVGVVPVASLGAGGATALSRARRLVAPARPLSTRAVAAVCAATMSVVLLPLVLAISPPAVALRMVPCVPHPASTSAQT